MNQRNKIKPIVAGALIGLLLLVICFAFSSTNGQSFGNITANSTNQTTDLSGDPAMQGDNTVPAAGNISEADLNKLETGDAAWLSAVTDLTEQEASEIMQKKELSAATFNKSSSSLYLVFEEDNALYRVRKVSSGFISFAKLKGIDVKAVNFEEDAAASTETPALRDSVKYKIAAAGLLILAIAIVAVRKYNSKVSAKEGVRDGKTKGRTGSKLKVRLADVEVIEGLKDDVMSVIDFLKNPKKYQEIGARLPKGIMLYGPPGTGKTLLAKALAEEAGVPFLHAAGSDFVEQFVGVGAKRVRGLYAEASKKAPCIVFIDEIDALCGTRDNNTNDERAQTLNALLAEMDGFASSDTVFTIAATNRLDMLDSAVTRAGRFDLKLAVGLPDKKARYKILSIHSKNKKMDSDVDLQEIAEKTQQFSGAELENLLNVAAIDAVRKGKTRVSNEEIKDAYFKIIMKGNKKNRESISETNRIVAWHESGHTLATKLLTDDAVPSVTIVGSSSGAGGVTFRMPKDDYKLHSRKYLENLVKVMYAGRAAEELYFGNTDDITIGASQDIKQATSIIREYLSVYGMGSTGMLDLTQFEQDYDAIFSEASDMANRLYGETVSLLSDNRSRLEALAAELLKKETLEENEIDEILAGMAAA